MADENRDSSIDARRVRRIEAPGLQVAIDHMEPEALGRVEQRTLPILTARVSSTDWGWMLERPLACRLQTTLMGFGREDTAQIMRGIFVEGRTPLNLVVREEGEGPLERSGVTLVPEAMEWGEALECPAIGPGIAGQLTPEQRRLLLEVHDAGYSWAYVAPLYRSAWVWGQLRNAVAMSGRDKREAISNVVFLCEECGDRERGILESIPEDTTRQEVYRRFGVGGVLDLRPELIRGTLGERARQFAKAEQEVNRIYLMFLAVGCPTEKIEEAIECLGGIEEAGDWLYEEACTAREDTLIVDVEDGQVVSYRIPTPEVQERVGRDTTDSRMSGVEREAGYGRLKYSPGTAMVRLLWRPGGEEPHSMYSYPRTTATVLGTWVVLRWLMEKGEEGDTPEKREAHLALYTEWRGITFRWVEGYDRVVANRYRIGDTMPGCGHYYILGECLPTWVQGTLEALKAWAEGNAGDWCPWEEGEDGYRLKQWEPERKSKVLAGIYHGFLRCPVIPGVVNVVDEGAIYDGVAVSGFYWPFNTTVWPWGLFREPPTDYGYGCGIERGSRPGNSDQWRRAWERLEEGWVMPRVMRGRALSVQEGIRWCLIGTSRKLMDSMNGYHRLVVRGYCAAGIKDRNGPWIMTMGEGVTVTVPNHHWDMLLPLLVRGIMVYPQVDLSPTHMKYSGALTNRSLLGICAGGTMDSLFQSPEGGMTTREYARRYGAWAALARQYPLMNLDSIAGGTAWAVLDDEWVRETVGIIAGVLRKLKDAKREDNEGVVATALGWTMVRNVGYLVYNRDRWYAYRGVVKDRRLGWYYRARALRKVTQGIVPRYNTKKIAEAGGREPELVVHPLIMDNWWKWGGSEVATGYGTDYGWSDDAGAPVPRQVATDTQMKAMAQKKALNFTGPGGGKVYVKRINLSKTTRRVQRQQQKGASV